MIAAYDKPLYSVPRSFGLSTSLLHREYILRTGKALSAGVQW